MSSSGRAPAFSPPARLIAAATARSVAAKDELQLVLASTSPRRRQVLDYLGLPCTVLDAAVDEHPLNGEAPEALALRLAKAKAQVGASRYPGSLAIGADTVVALGALTLGKPVGPGEARTMLRQLRDREHRVISAVAAARVDPSTGETRLWHRLNTAQVRMRAYNDDEIEAYVASGDPFDKAGAYAIQDPSFRPVQTLDGCFLSVMGLPLPDLCDLMDEAGAGRPTLSIDLLATLCPGCNDAHRLLQTSP